MICAVIDGAGIYGTLLHYGLVIAFVSSAFLIFFTLWWHGKLNMDEEPKFLMMREQEQEEKSDESQ